MEIDNIIYIVLIIAVFILSLIGQTRKKKVSIPIKKIEEVHYSLNDFEKILERKQEYINVEEPKSSVEGIVADEPINAGIEHNTTNMEESANKEKKETNEINDGFDIKSAIIYSSILERKKFRH